MISLNLVDNITFMETTIKENKQFDLIYADCIYESLELAWACLAWKLLKLNGIFIVQTDYHSSAQYKILLDNQLNSVFVNWCIYKQEWGGVSKRYFPRKHDDILIYAKGKNYKFYPERIKIPKVTANTKLDKRGDGLKTPCDVFDDLGNFMTTSKERIKKSNKNIQWQKPLKLMNRLLLPFTDEHDHILDVFMGSGTTGVWCRQNNRSFTGVESDKAVFEIAKNRIEKENI